MRTNEGIFSLSLAQSIFAPGAREISTWKSEGFFYFARSSTTGVGSKKVFLLDSHLPLPSPRPFPFQLIRLPAIYHSLSPLSTVASLYREPRRRRRRLMVEPKKTRCCVPLGIKHVFEWILVALWILLYLATALEHIPI